MSIAQDDDLFKTGKVFFVPDKELDEVLKRLAAEWNSPALGTMILVRVSIINTIKQQRHLDQIDNRNKIFTWIIIGLTLVSIFTQLLPIILTSFGGK